MAACVHRGFGSSSGRRRSGLPRAAAAAIAGLDQVRASTGALAALEVAVDVEAQRSPGSGGRRSSPGTSSSRLAPLEAGARKTWSSPSASACAFTRPEPGTTSASLTLAATRPGGHDRAASQVLDAELVHDPMKTLSMAWISRHRLVGASSAMYFSARAPSRRRSRRAPSGIGHAPTPVTISGWCPR